MTKILIVDDSPVEIKIIRKFLEADYEILEANNGQAAIELANTSCPNLILLDIVMPEMDGLTVCKILKHQPATRDIPIIFITSISDSRNVVNGFDSGGQDYITKPFCSQELCARIRVHLELQKSKETAQNYARELETANKTIRQQNLHLQKLFNIQQSLIQLALCGEGLRGITKTLSAITDSAILVFNDKIQTLVMPAWDKKPYLLLQKKIQFFLENTANFFTGKQAAGGLATEAAPAWVDFKIENDVFPCAFVPIVVKAETCGYIVAIPNDKTKQDFIPAIRNSANIYAIELMKQKTIVDLKQQFCGNFLDSLLARSPADEQTLKVWADRLGFDVSAAHTLIAMESGDSKAKPYTAENAALLSDTDFLDFITVFLKTCHPSILCGRHKEKIIFLLPWKNHCTKEKVAAVLCQIKQKLTPHFSQLSFFFGVSRITGEATDYAKAYHQAVECLAIAKMFNQNSGMAFYDDLGSLALLFGANNKKELLNFMEEKLDRLIAHDKKNNTELLKTLDQYLDNNSIQETSKESALSVSGLKYRLNKIKELGYDLQSQQERFDLKIALNIWKIKQMV
ncbi:MAG: response regulator [Veillonellales bacterium]